MTTKIAKQEEAVKMLCKTMAKTLRSVLSGVAVCLFATIGTAFLITSKAATPTASFEAENGSLSGNVAVISDTATSNGSAVKFGTTVTGEQVCPALPAYPDEACTGTLAGTTLTNSGPMTVSQDGAVVENLNITGRLTITGSNVTIRNIYLTTDDYYGVMVYGSNITIQDSTLIGSANTQAPLVAVSGGSFHALRMDISGAPDGVTLGNDSSLTDSYVHDLVNCSGCHNDGINADGRLRTSVIHSTVLNAHDQTSAMWIGNAQQPSSLIVRDNLFAGGGYTIYAGLGGGAGQGIRFENNVFSRRYFTNSGFYGPVAYWQGGNGNTWVNNRYEDGTAITP